MLDSLHSGDRISLHHQLSQTDKHHCINPVLNVILLHVHLFSQPHENMEVKHPPDLPDMKFTIQIARHGEEKWSKKEKTESSLETKNSFRSGKVASDPNLDLMDFAL